MTESVASNPGPPASAEHWEDRYLRQDIPWNKGRVDANLQGALRDFSVGPCRVLEVGCGTGTDARWLAAQGFAVTGVDLSATAIQRARHGAAQEGVEVRFEVGSFPEAAGTFELLYDCGCFHALGSLEERLRFVAMAASRLVDDARWLSILGSADGPPRDHGPPRRSAADIVTALEGTFEILSLRSAMYDADVPTPARSWVVLARKRAG